jgi:hypothetical protein
MRKAFGALWRVLQGDLYRRQGDGRRADSETANEEDDTQPNGLVANGHGLVAEDDEEDDIHAALQKTQHLETSERPDAPPLYNLFVSRAPVTLGGEHYIDSNGQMETFEWCLGVMRELADDGKEYLGRLEEIRNGLGQASAVRASVWQASRQAALEEMTEERGA